MPKIFEYLGIILFFYSNEHEQIHLHATYGFLESKAEFFILDGKITEIKIRPVQNRKPLKGLKLKDFEIFLESYAYQIVQKWIDYFIFKKEVAFERISKKIS